jgi:rhodanese-related sulfurtransferase
MMERTITPQELEERRAGGAAFLLLDVRRTADFDAGDDMLPGARRADPERIDQWGSELDRATPVVIYCVRGGSVSQSVSATLTERGFDVRYIEGGITAWKAAGNAGVAKGMP